MRRGVRRGVRLGLDWGDARIGVAACDPDATMAFPVATVSAGPDVHAAVAALVEQYEPIEIVVGLPRSLSGAEGPAAARVRAAALALVTDLRAGGSAVGVRLVDERLTTVQASRQLRAAGKRARAQRAVIDSVAAAGILEHALAVEGAGGTPPGELLSPPERRPQDSPDEEIDA